MFTEALKRLFRPRGVAISAPSTPGEEVPLLARNIAEGGYQGRIVLLGEGPPPPPPFQRYSTPAEAGPGLDLALVAGEVQGLATSLAALGSAGVKAVVAYGPSPPGEAWRASLSAAARAAGVRLVGPGSWGLVNSAVGLVAAQERPSLRHGGLALVTQSGAVCGYCLAEGAQRGLGWGLVLDLGAEVDLSQDEVIDYLATHYQAKALMLHLGRVRRPASFMSAALAASRLKPVVAIKTGEYACPCPITPSDTFPEPYPGEAWDAALNRAGVLCVDSLDELLSFGELAGRRQECRGPRMLVVSASAGAGRLALDANRRHGLALAKLEEHTRLALAELGCQAADEQGLVLMGPAVDEATFQAVATACLQDPGVDAMLAVLAPCRCLEPANLAQALCRAAAQGQAGPRQVLALAVWPGAAKPESQDPLRESITIFATPERAVEAYAGLWRHTEIMRVAKQIPRKPLGRFQLDRPAAYRLLEDAVGQGRSTLYVDERLELLNAYRLPVLPVQAVHSPAELQQVCEVWGYPARLLLAPRPASGSDHRPELTARLDDPTQVQERWQVLHQKAARQGLDIQEALVQPWPSTAEPSLMMGWHRHPELGPLLVFGEGGERPGTLRERSWGLPPLNRALAQALMARTQVYAMVTEGERCNRVWPSMLEEVLIKLSQMAQYLPQIKNLNVNPVLLADKMAWFADARVELAPVVRPAPPHLIVSPYPEGHEVRARCEDGLEVLLRPIRPEDADLVRKFFSRLSSESIYHRFFRDLPGLSSQMLLRLTQVDYDREIALAAMWTHGMTEKMLGLCSLAQRPGSQWAEFAVLVEDHWQRHGIGKLLLTQVLKIARSRGQLNVMGVVLRQNRAMLELGRSVGFRADKPQNGLVELRRELEGEPALFG
ncbi:MAG: GNAT family N-acetyltransferase [Proteobacteria bacterium]|nr:GNAT family N-acetyltransferase [Pseudomonadota bacterium]MBU1449814.1 GNAT family N-acetyltransferase [Pseudomonadota bacterium]MBU2467570.1 GNAT family N-acetyltransferase [Pseudomonadota bacterium]MBU2517271.1 GNAT family N-acetyltransferase [Pseudomonadota bacterium]